MKKMTIKFLNILLIISIFLSPINTFALTQAEVKAGASKGDIYNPQNNTVSSTSTTVTATNGTVDVEKRVRKVNDTGLYNVSFWVKGKKTVNSVPKDTYIVFVMDRSYTMGTNSRWENAKSAVISISSQLSNISKVKMALVGFSGGKSSKSVPWDDVIVPRPEFSNAAFTAEEFGNYDTDYTHYGGTNIQGGLLKAQELLNGKNGNKYVILLSDGVPTFYYDESGNTLGPGNSDEGKKIAGVPNCRDAAITVANAMKTDTTIYTIGYDLNNLNHEFTYNGVYYNERSLAVETLSGIATTGKYFTASTTNNNTITSELQKIENEITTYYAGSNPSVTDGIGSSFKLSTNTNYGGSKSLTTNNEFVIDDAFKKIGEFNVQIDTTVDTGWYATNNNFTLTYKDAAGVTRTISSNKNPEVKWVNKYNYTVNYYKDSITNTSDSSHFLNGYSNMVDNGTVINKSDINLLQYIPEGYYLDGMYNADGTLKIDSLTVDKTKQNVINILYKIKKFDYKVNYYYADLNNRYGAPDSTKTIKDVNYGTNVTTSSHYLADKDIKEGYSLDEVTTKNITYTIRDGSVVVNIYYKRNNYGYKVNYHFNGTHDTSLDFVSSAIYGSSVSATDKYLENINSNGLLNKNMVDNTNYFLEPYNVNNISSILIGTNYLLNVLNLYYVDTKIVSEDIEKNSDIDVVTSSDTPITYTVNYDSVINNVRKDEVVEVTIVDRLPYKIDEELSNLNGGVYDEEELTVTWINSLIVDDFTKVYNVSKDIDYTVVYKEFADISARDDNKLINSVTGTTKVGNLSTPGVVDTEIIDVLIEGKVIVHYITKDNEVLTDSIEITGLVGSDYETIKKKFNQYSFIELRGEAVGKIKDGVIEVFYIYDLTPLPPKTGDINNNLALYIEYLISCVGVFIFSSKKNIFNK